MKFSHTARGFAHLAFEDSHNVKCSIQNSSLAEEDAIWFGVVDANPKILKDGVWEPVVIKNERGGRDVLGNPIPITGFGKDILIATRMHLTRTYVKKLVKEMNRWLNKGILKKRFFRDRYFAACTIEKAKDCMKLGIFDPNPQICDQGWRPFKYPEGTDFTTYMFLSKEHVEGLLPTLKLFLEIGSIEQY